MSYVHSSSQWASWQIRKIAGCAGNAGNVFPRRRFQRKLLVSDPGMHHGTCVTHVPWCMSGSLICGGGENVPGIPGACAPAILCIWQEAHEWVVILCKIASSHSPISVENDIASCLNCKDFYSETTGLLIYATPMSIIRQIFITYILMMNKSHQTFRNFLFVLVCILFSCTIYLLIYDDHRWVAFLITHL